MAHSKAHFGELLQLDGSHHKWLEQRGPKGCLMNLVDDATGRALCRFTAEETTWAAADLLEAWVRTHGIPQALYCDGKNVYQRRATTREQLEGIEPETQFGRMCRKLGIRIIPASSPEAKGRVERHHGTHQDRLLKKMRLEGIADYEAANRYLEQEYLPAHNARFAREPAAAEGFGLAMGFLSRSGTGGVERPGDSVREPLFAVTAEAQPGAGGGRACDRAASAGR